MLRLPMRQQLKPGSQPTFFFKRGTGIETPDYHPRTVLFLEALSASTPPHTLGSENELALDRLVRDLHGESNSSYTTFDIWNQFKAIYPMIGGTAFSHSLNLIDQSLFAITWSGSPSHSANGVQFNGSSFGDTGLSPATHMTLNSSSLGFYSRTQTLGGSIDMGAKDDSGIGIYNIFNYGGDLYTQINSTQVYRGVPSWANLSQGLLICSRTSATDISYGLTEAFTNNYTDSSISLPVYSIYIGAVHTSSALSNTYRQCALAFIANGFDATKQTFLQKAVQAYQTALGRNV